MTPNDLIDDLRSRINPAYAAVIGTESYERRLCAEALETLQTECDELKAHVWKSREAKARKHETITRLARATNVLRNEIHALKAKITELEKENAAPCARLEERKHVSVPTLGQELVSYSDQKGDAE